MKQLYVRLSLAFFSVIVLTVVLIFTFIFAFSWLGQEDFSQEAFAHEYDHVAVPFVAHYLIEGKSDAEISALLGDDQQLERLIADLRAEGFGPGFVEDTSFRRIAGDYLFELTDPGILIIVIIGTLLGALASVILSRQLTRPLATLTDASHALGQHDLSRRVDVSGSQEIDDLALAFNQMADQLERAEQIRQNMLADVSHELRTPLAGLEGTLRATLDGVFELNNEHVSNLYVQAQHLTRLVDDLHLLARAEAHRLNLEKSELDVAQLVHDLAGAFEGLAQAEGIILERNISPVQPIEGDAIRIRQVVSNLLSNALRHTPAGGTVAVTVGLIENGIEIVVADTGEGIEAEFLPHLFDRFYRVDPSRSREKGGTGLGLAITKALVEAHGGTISAESDGGGKGSRFTVILTR